jgi:plasmid stabilization system protein ParE
VSRFLFGRYVESDLREIRDQIGRDSAEAARRLMVRFVTAFRLLAQRPELGTCTPGFAAPIVPLLARGILLDYLSLREAAD